MKGNGPIKKFREGNIEAAIWEQVGKNPEENKRFFTISLKKSWKKKGTDEKWKSVTVSFHKDEISRVFSVLQQATEELENMLPIQEEDVVG